MSRPSLAPTRLRSFAYFCDLLPNPRQLFPSRWVRSYVHRKPFGSRVIYVFEGVQLPASSPPAEGLYPPSSLPSPHHQCDHGCGPELDHRLCHHAANRRHRFLPAKVCTKNSSIPIVKFSAACSRGSIRRRCRYCRDSSGSRWLQVAPRTFCGHRSLGHRSPRRQAQQGYPRAHFLSQ